MDGKAPTLGGFRLAARNDAPDFRDFTYEPALIPLAPVLAAPDDLQVRDQGPGGACTGFGLAAVIDCLVRKARGASDTPVTEPVSARMLYEMALRYDEWPDAQDAGSSCRGAIKGWYNMGVCREALYPSDGSRGWSVDAAKDARNTTIGAYYRLGARISDYHAALNEVGAIFCSASVHRGWSEPDADSGAIPLDRHTLGGHAFAIVGYDAEGFWIQNSWGPGWGRNGTARWSYEDWQLNVKDAWVFQLALPTPQIWHLPPRSLSLRSGTDRSPRPQRAEIAGHFVHVDDGRFHDQGPYWSHLEDVKLTAKLVAESDAYQHLLFYAHGGLNSPGASATRIAAMKETFKDNGVYPYHFMYDTGLLEELKDVIVGHRRSADARAGGLPDWVDQLVEKLTRVPGRALWREMKSGARLPFEAGMAGSQVLRAFVEAFAASGKPKQLHLCGHSTGMILLSHLLPRLAATAPGLRVETTTFLAPAGTVDAFTQRVQPFLKAPHPEFRIRELTIYNLSDALEQDDEVTRAYNKSLLYLVSRAFEETVPERILGMEKYSEAVGRRRLPRLTIHYSEGRVPGARVTASETHGGFDNDPLTMNHVLRRILDKPPVREFTRENLAY